MCRVKRIIFLCLTFAPLVSAMAQTPVIQSNRSVASKIAPAYFGPNAFPVPEMTDGRPHSSLYSEIAADYFRGSLGDGNDKTWDTFARISVPLWSSRASLELWMPIVEWWNFSPAVATERRIAPKQYKGHDSGDVYVCTSLYLVEGCDNAWKPDILVRSVLKTASGNSYRYARYYDSPGYFFDVTAGEGFIFNSFVKELRIALCGGFLCWQTDNGRQNDAVQAGFLTSMDTRLFRITAELGSYSGWENDGDRPVRGRIRLDLHLWKTPVYPFVQSCIGLKDYPFTSLRAGIAFSR